MRIFLDPGHGGRDPGAVSATGAREKDIVLTIAALMKTMLTRPALAGEHQVTLSRTTDTARTLTWRANQANHWGAGVFLSLHCNAHTTASANGTETWFRTGNQESQLLAVSIQQSLVEVLARRDRGVRHNNSFAVLRQTTMPAALIEYAFLSNPEEANLLTNFHFQQQAAQATVAGLLAWIEDRNTRHLITIQKR